MVTLSTFDFISIILFFTITISIGIYVSKKSSKSSSEFFLSGRTMRCILGKIAHKDTSNLGDASTLLNPEVVQDIMENAL